MDIKTKLRYIHEGYSFQDIKCGTFETIQDIMKETDEIFMESVTNDIQYIIESSLKTTFIDHMKKILKWLKDKVIQFINFIKHKLFSSRKGTKETVKSVRETVKQVKNNNVKSKPPIHNDHKNDDHAEDHHDNAPHQYEFQHDNGALEYRPETHEITLFSKILTDENFFDNGFKKVYNVLSNYIQKLERNPQTHETVITEHELVDINPFMDRIFKEALSVKYDKTEIFKKIYGDVITKTVTVQDLLTLTDKLQKLDAECEKFAEWIQRFLPSALDRVEASFEIHVRHIKDRIDSGFSKDADEDKRLIEEFNICLSKIIKLMNVQMSIIQIFARIHADVFIHLRTEVEHYDWVLNPVSHEGYEDYGYDNNGLIH